MVETYFIHDTGGRPFKVVIDEQLHVTVYQQDSNDYTEYTNDPVLDVETEKVFVGESPLIAMTEFSGGHGEYFKGNTILLKMDTGGYIYIGSTIESFTTEKEIVEYVSPVGNNDVPYPYAVDEDENRYLILEHVAVKDCQDVEDPYQYYYNKSLMTPDMRRIPPKQPQIPNFNGVEEFRLGPDRYTMRYNSEPEKDFDRWASDNDMIPMRIKFTTGETQEFTKEMYVDLINAFGVEAGFTPCTYTTLVGRVY